MLLTIKDLSAFLNIPPSTLYAWVAQGKIPFYKIHGLIRFRLKAIVRWLKSFSRGEAKPLPRKPVVPDQGDLNALIARVKRVVYTADCGKPDQDRARKGGD